MSWDYDLSTASFRGVEFEVKHISDGCKRRWSRHRYPYVDGADIEDMGREEQETVLAAVFVGPDYLERLSDLIQAVKGGQAGVFIHPLLGIRTGRMTIEKIEHDDSFRDGCLLDLTFVEDGSGGDVDPVTSIYALELELEDVLTDVESALDDAESALDKIGKAVDDVQDSIDSAREFVTDATSSVTKAVNSMNKTIKKVQKAIDSAVKLGDVQSYPITSALRRTSRTVQKLAERVMGDKWPMREFATVATVPAALLAQSLYGDATRADELVEMNSGLIRNPLAIPAGLALKVFNS